MNLGSIFSSSALFIWSFLNCFAPGAGREATQQRPDSQQAQFGRPSLTSPKRFSGKQRNCSSTTVGSEFGTRHRRKLQTSKRYFRKQLLRIARKARSFIALPSCRKGSKVLPDRKQQRVHSDTDLFHGSLKYRSFLPEHSFANTPAHKSSNPVHERGCNDRAESAKHNRATRNVRSILSFKKVQQLVDPNTNEKLKRSFNAVGPFEIHRTPSFTDGNLGESGQLTQNLLSLFRNSVWSCCTHTTTESVESFSASESQYSESSDIVVS